MWCLRRGSGSGAPGQGRTPEVYGLVAPAGPAFDAVAGAESVSPHMLLRAPAFGSGGGGEVAAVASRRRWWVPMTRTPRQALWLGAANGILGLVEVVGVLTLALRP